MYMDGVLTPTHKGWAEVKKRVWRYLHLWSPLSHPSTACVPKAPSDLRLPHCPEAPPQQLHQRLPFLAMLKYPGLP